jgi:hypothetical protein
MTICPSSQHVLGTCADQCTRIFDQERVVFDRYLQLPYEVGGYVYLAHRSADVSVHGELDYPGIDHLPVYPVHTYGGIVDWHTHHNSIPSSVDNLPPDAPRILPSDTDFMSLLRAAARKRKPCMSCVVSKWGYFYVLVTPAFLERAKRESCKKWRKAVCVELGDATYRFFHSRGCLRARANRFVEAMRPLGLACRMDWKN